ncbi:MAG: hypothetical protein M3Z25_09910 [Actinomycetota bacterium]|nr:hypothetical protein [Actinomycetota bacterium]
MLSLIVTLPLVVLYEEDRGRAVEVRTKCWQRLVPRLVKSKVGELTIERIDGEDERDRRDIRAALTGLDALGAIVYRHTEPAAEPLLWIADAAAWTCGARKLWRSQLAPVIVD